MPITADSNDPTVRLQGNCTGFSAVLTSIRCSLRGLLLLFSDRPKTPLRVLCVIAFDTLHRLRNPDPLSDHKIRVLSALLDFAASANAALDRKKHCPGEYESTRLQLEAAGIGGLIDEYVRQLGELERQRPLPGGERQQFHDARLYREAVARLSLGVVTATATGTHDLDEGIKATVSDEALGVLFRIVMQCQIIDDVMDYSKDLSAGLPGFMTAPATLRQAIELADEAARIYANHGSQGFSNDLLPLTLALTVVSATARFVIGLGRCRLRICGNRSNRTSNTGVTQQAANVDG